MHRIGIVLIAATLFAASAGAADGYTFHIRATDGRTGLRSNPDFEKLSISAEDLAKIADSRVVVLDATKGTHWRWLMLSWFDGDPAKEQSIDDRGSAPRDRADFALSAGKAGHFRLRCLQDECGVDATSGGRSTTLRLSRGELSPDLALDADLSLTFKRRP